MRLVLAAIGALVGLAQATTSGGGSPLTDCLAEFSGTPANSPVTRPRDIRCIDDDPACDDDPTPGVCGFHIGVCLNVIESTLPACAPADLDAYVVENPQPDTNPEHDFDFQGLQDALEFLTLPVDTSQRDVCA